MVDVLLAIGIAFALATGGTTACWIIHRSMARRKTAKWRALAVATEAAGIRYAPEVLMTVGVAVLSVLWFFATVALGASVLVVVLSYPIVLAGQWLVRWYAGLRAGMRRAKFLDQLETALRLMSSGIRVGLSLPQAIAGMAGEMDEPARTEFLRVVGQTRIGVPTADALDDLAERMPGGETKMLARVIRVQQQTGGSLSTILEHLAETIKDRRRIARKITALTAEGRMGAVVLEALPLVVGGFIMLTQPAMSQALVHTLIGHITLGLVVVLEVLAVWSLNRMLQVTV